MISVFLLYLIHGFFVEEKIMIDLRLLLFIGYLIEDRLREHIANTINGSNIVEIVIKANLYLFLAFLNFNDIIYKLILAVLFLRRYSTYVQ